MLLMGWRNRNAGGSNYLTKPLFDGAPSTKVSIDEDKTKSIKALAMSVSSRIISLHFICCKNTMKSRIRDQYIT